MHTPPQNWKNSRTQLLNLHEQRAHHHWWQLGERTDAKRLSCIIEGQHSNSQRHKRRWPFLCMHTSCLPQIQGRSVKFQSCCPALLRKKVGLHDSTCDWQVVCSSRRNNPQHEFKCFQLNRGGTPRMRLALHDLIRWLWTIVDFQHQVCQMNFDGSWILCWVFNLK